MDLLSFIQLLGSRRIRGRSGRYMKERRQAEQRRRALPQGLASQGSDSISPGATLHGERITISPSVFSRHGLVLGATGSGKSMAVISLIDQLRQREASGGESIGWGVVDAKGELVRRIQERLGPEDEAVTLDFSGHEPVPYGLLHCRHDESAEELVERRMAVFADVLGREGPLSLRMGRMLRAFLFLAVEQHFSFPTLECLFSNPDSATRLAKECLNGRVKSYFAADFNRERQSTLPALSARLDFLLRHERLRLSFSCHDFVDFRQLMDRGVPVLVCCGGPSVSRSLSATIQSLVLSDIRKDIFSRIKTDKQYLFFFDEAQCLFDRSGDVENLLSVLAMSRSFGTHLVLVTQSLKAALSSPEFVASLETNFRWLFSFRCGPSDAQILKPAIPLSGRVVRDRTSKGDISYMTPSQELSLRLDEVTNLDDRCGYFWLRGAGAKAVLVRSHTVEEPAPRQPTENRAAPSTDSTAIREQLRAEEERVLRRSPPPEGSVRRNAKPAGDISETLRKLERQVESHGRD